MKSRSFCLWSAGTCASMPHSDIASRSQQTAPLFFPWPRTDINNQIQCFPSTPPPLCPLFTTLPITWTDFVILLTKFWKSPLGKHRIYSSFLFCLAQGNFCSINHIAYCHALNPSLCSRPTSVCCPSTLSDQGRHC